MAAPQQDLLHALAREHRDHLSTFHHLASAAEGAPVRWLRRRLSALILHLGVHLSAERLLVHPLVLPSASRGQETLQRREGETAILRERFALAGEALDDPERLLAALGEASSGFAAHADHEELEVFVHARHAATPQQLRRMGRLHATLQQRLAARYLRNGAAPDAPWEDAGLLDTVGAWYLAALPQDAAPGRDATPC